MADELTDEQWQAIEAELFAGRKITAIKLFREHAGADLLTAKEAMDRHELALRERSPEHFAASSKAGCLGVLIAIGAPLAAWWGL